MRSMSDSEDIGLSINKAYAEKYEGWRRKEELQKLKDRHGDVNAFGEDPDESSSSESEDDEAEELTPKVEASWLKTLAALKAKDPKIYRKETIFFEPEGSTENNKAAKLKKKSPDSKPFTLKDYERALILEKEGKYVDDDGSDSAMLPGKRGRGYYDEQEELRRSIKAAAGVDEKDSDDELLAIRTKTTAEEEEEEDAYHRWLMGQKSSRLPEDEAHELEPLRQHCKESDENEKYLWDYLLNKRYISKDEDEAPASDEVTKDDVDLSEEEEILDQQETFERKYNFRFEEPDPDFIKNYPRTIDDSVRRKDTRRAEKRKENKERKDQEKDRRRQELKRLKNLKRKELLEKVSVLKVVSGHSEFKISERELDEDFDPEKHDAQMRANFGADYYGEGGEELKPTFEYDPELDGEDWDAWAGPPAGSHREQSAPSDNGTDAVHDDDQPDVIHMDAEFNPPQTSSDTRGRRKKRRGRGSKFADILSADKPPFDPEDKTFEEYVNEYYKFDYEDIVGDMPVRFKYRTVVANDFGLTVDEVLAAREKELNAWCSLKKAVQCRTEEEELIDRRMYAKKARDTEKKKRLIPSIASLLEGSSAASFAANRAVVPDAKPAAAAANGAEAEPPNADSSAQRLETPKKRRRRKKNRAEGQAPSASESEAASAAAPVAVAAPPPRLFAPRGQPTAKAVAAAGSARAGGAQTVGSVSAAGCDSAKADAKKKKSKKRKFTPDVISDERLKAYGFNPKKFKYLAKSKKSTGS